MSDELLERLGTYFVYHSIYGRFNIPFHQFIKMVQHGAWQGFIEAQ